MNYSKSFKGWFGETAKDVHYESMTAIADSLAQYYKKNGSPGQKLVIAYDTRFLAKEFAEHIACVMAKKGVKVFLSNRPAPSSVALVAALHKKSLGAIVVTGDEYNAKYIGIRAYDTFGYTLTDNQLSEYEPSQEPISLSSLHEYMKKGVIELFDASIAYDLFVHKRISFEDMTPSIHSLLFNPYYGSGMYYFDYTILPEKNIHGATIHSERVADFKQREPSPKQLYEQMVDVMKNEQLDLGFITSPDCTSFEFLVGHERLSKQEALRCLIDVLYQNDEPVRVLTVDENEWDADWAFGDKALVHTCAEKDFDEEMKTKNYDIGLDVYERFYFQHHGAPDALLCGFYLFFYFNEKNRTHTTAQAHLEQMRNK